MGVHWCLLGPAGEEGLREEWMDSAVLRTSTNVCTAGVKIGI